MRMQGRERNRLGAVQPKQSRRAILMHIPHLGELRCRWAMRQNAGYPVRGDVITHLLPYLCAVSLLCASCSIDGRGLGVKTRYYVNSDGTGAAVEVRSVGLSVATVVPGRGVTIGRSQKTYFVLNRQAPASALPPTIGTGSELLTAEGFDWSSRDVVAAASATDGITLHAGGTKAGITLGSHRRTLLWVPRNTNRWLYFSRCDGSPTRLAVKEHPSCD